MKDYLKVFKFSIKNCTKYSPILTVFIGILTIVGAQLPFLASKVSSDIINSLIDYIKTPSAGTVLIFKLALLWALIESARSIFDRLENYLVALSSYKIMAGMEKMYMDHVSGLDLGRIESQKFQNLEQRAMRRQMWPITETFRSVFYFMRPVSIVITSSLILGLLDWRIYVIAIIAVIPQVLIERKYGKRSWGIWGGNQGEDQRRYHQFKYNITNSDSMPEIKRFGALKYFKDRTLKIFTDTQNELQKNESERFRKYTGVEVINIITFIATIFILIGHITDGTILVGAFLFYSQTIDRFSSAVSEIFSTLTYQEENIGLVKDIVEYFEVTPLVMTKNPVAIPIKTPEVGPEIVFENVVFKYPDTDKVILNNISFVIKPGERTGLIGINGAGKSTIVKLLLRIYDPTEGKITIGGVDLRNIEPEAWWTHLSVLMQDYNNYKALTLKDSIMLSNMSREENLDEKRMISSLKKSKADVFVNQWEKKFDAMLGKSYNGESLSKGQSQKLALARTFYKEASVMILDEPTAAIDAESEIEIFEELENLPRTVSILYISHDMATIKKADKIMLIEDGKIVENGDHNQLMKKRGHYARIYNAQLNNLTKKTA